MSKRELNIQSQILEEQNRWKFILLTEKKLVSNEIFSFNENIHKNSIVFEIISTEKFSMQLIYQSIKT